METTELSVKKSAELPSAIEKVLVQGDLAPLKPEERVQYYKTVCESLGLNPYTKPFSYITLNGKLTLYANKDAADQLRRIYGVSIDDVSREMDGDLIIVEAKGHDATGRTDVEIGVVNKKEMGGNIANALMKANTKAKRRLTLSLVGLGWLDETEIESIPKSQAQVVDVDDDGNIVEATRIDSKAIVVENPNTNTPKEEKPVEAQEKPKFDEHEFLRKWTHKATISISGKPVRLQGMNLEAACQVKDGNGKEYGTHATERLYYMLNAIIKKIPTLTNQDAKDTYMMKLSAINEILSSRASALEQLDAIPDPFINKGDSDVQDG